LTNEEIAIELQAQKWVGVTQLDVGVAAKPPEGAILTPYKGCFRADYRPPLHKMTNCVSPNGKVKLQG